MSVNVTFNGLVYPVPTQGDTQWAPPLTRYLVAIGNGALAPSGGNFTLTADVNFGPTFGLLSKYFTSVTTTPATSGTLRLAKTDAIDWRNNANSGNNVLAVNSSDILTYNGVAVPTGLSTLPDGTIWIGSGSNLPVAQTLTGDITTTDLGVTSIGAGRIVNSQISNSAAIAYSKLSLTGSILNADIFSAAAIALTKLAALSAAIVPVTNGSGFLTSSSVTATTLGFLDATSSIQTQLNGKQASGSYITALTGDVTAAGPGSSAATLATVNSNVGSFTAANITVNAKGLITAASSGSAGGTVTNVTGTANQISVATGTTTPVISIANPVTFPGAMTAGGALAMGSNKITGLANGTASNDAINFSQISGVRVLQIISTTIGSEESVSASTSYTNFTTVKVSITLQSASSKVLILLTGSLFDATLTSNLILGVRRASTQVGTAETQLQTNAAFDTSFALNAVETSPGAGSAVYSLAVKTGSGSATITAETGTTMIVIEVG